jgi:hypothetical protein
MSPAQKGAILSAIVLGVLGIVKLVIQSRANKELQQLAAEKEKRLAELQREREERLARHQREAEERAADRAQKEQSMAQLQKATDDTLAILKSELAAQQKTNDRAFDLLDRNTRATEIVAQTLAAQQNVIAVIASEVTKISAGGGCRGRAA